MHWRRHRPKSHTWDNHWPQYPVLQLDQIGDDDLSDVPRNKYGLIDLIELLGVDYKARVSVSVIAYDSRSGTRKLFYRRFYKDDFEISNEPDSASASAEPSAPQPHDADAVAPAAKESDHGAGTV
jgi:hypothetical protein